MISTKQLITYKVLFALLGFSAVVTEIATLVERGTFNAVNFFSYFTVLSNVLAAAVLMISAIWTAKGSRNRVIDMIRGASVLYMVMTGIIFSVLLSGLDPDALTAVAWDNTVLHYIMPAAVLLDWILDRPKRKLAFQKNLIWIIFPISYVVYTLVRGEIVGWYPYPFFNPSIKGYQAVAAVSAALTILVFGIVWAITASTQKKENINPQIV